MKYKVKWNGEEITIFIGEGKSVTRWGLTRYQYPLKITYKNNTETFKVYSSDILSHNEVENKKDVYLLASAVFEDATAYINSPTLFDFLNDFGYGDCDDVAGKNAFNECLNTYTKLKGLGMDDNTMFDFANKLRNY